MGVCSLIYIWIMWRGQSAGSRKGIGSGGGGGVTVAVVVARPPSPPGRPIGPSLAISKYPLHQHHLKNMCAPHLFPGWGIYYARCAVEGAVGGC